MNPRVVLKRGCVNIALDVDDVICEGEYRTSRLNAEGYSSPRTILELIFEMSERVAQQREWREGDVRYTGQSNHVFHAINLMSGAGMRNARSMEWA